MTGWPPGPVVTSFGRGTAVEIVTGGPEFDRARVDRLIDRVFEVELFF
jgi:hypothetical protein